MPLHIDLIAQLQDKRVIKGLVTEVRPDAPVFVTRPVLLGEFRKRGYLQGISGKGVILSHSQLTCCAELVERITATFTPQHVSIRAASKEIGAALVKPEEIDLYSDAQYADDYDRRQSAYRMGHVPTKLGEAEQIDWTAVTEIRGTGSTYVPTGALFFGFNGAGADRVFCTSNGLAAGQSSEDACGRALLELVERDAVAIWWYNRLSLPGIKRADVERLTGIYLPKHAHALDLTNDTGIPVVAVVSINENENQPIMGFGAASSMKIAIEKAVLEYWQVCQLLPPLDGLVEVWKHTDIATTQPQLLKPERWVEVVDQSVECPVDRLRSVGLTCYSYNYDSREWGLPVVRTIVPGLRPFWDRRREGRLYEVPVKLGWRGQATRESELNPIPINL